MDLPNKRAIIKHGIVYKLICKHNPSLIKILNELFGFQPFIIKKNDGKIVHIHCTRGYDPNYVEYKINQRLHHYGYTANQFDRKIDVELPWYSLSTIFRKNNATALCGTFEHGLEHILFVAGNGFSWKELEKKIDEIAEPFKKQYGEGWIFEGKCNIESKDVYLPEFNGFYDWNYVQFLLKERSTKEQVATYDSLYLLSRSGFDVFSISTNDIIKLVVKHSGLDYRTVRNHIEKSGKQELHNKLYHRWAEKNRDIIDGLMPVKIPRELEDRINVNLLKKSIFLSVDKIFDYCANAFSLSPINPSILGKISIHEDGKSVIMYDSLLSCNTTVTLYDNKPFCEFHKFDNTQCLHIEKADLDGQLRKIHDNKEKPELPQRDTKQEEIYSTSLTLYYINSQLYNEYKNIAIKQKFVDKDDGDPDVSRALSYAIVSTLHTKLGKQHVFPRDF